MNQALKSWVTVGLFATLALLVVLWAAGLGAANAQSSSASSSATASAAPSGAHGHGPVNDDPEHAPPGNSGVVVNKIKAPQPEPILPESVADLHSNAQKVLVRPVPNPPNDPNLQGVEGSQVWSANNNDYSYLKSYYRTDDWPIACDGSDNGRQMVELVYNNSGVSNSFRDGYGSGCNSGYFLSYNADGHRSCNYWADGYAHGCGSYSNHQTISASLPVYYALLI